MLAGSSGLICKERGVAQQGLIVCPACRVGGQPLAKLA